MFALLVGWMVLDHQFKPERGSQFSPSSSSSEPDPFLAECNQHLSIKSQSHIACQHVVIQSRVKDEFVSAKSSELYISELQISSALKVRLKEEPQIDNPISDSIDNIYLEKSQTSSSHIAAMEWCNP